MERRYRPRPGLWPNDRLSSGLPVFRFEQIHRAEFRMIQIGFLFGESSKREIHGRTRVGRLIGIVRDCLGAG